MKPGRPKIGTTTEITGKVTFLTDAETDRALAELVRYAVINRSAARPQSEVIRQAIKDAAARLPLVDRSEQTSKK